MKKVSIVLVILLAAFNSFAQTTAPADFFAAKWEVLIVGTPNGDSKLVMELARKDGKLAGELKDPTGKMPDALPISGILEEGNKIILTFEAQGMDVNMDLEKVDDDHLKGSIMNGMFDASAVRVKQ